MISTNASVADPGILRLGAGAGTVHMRHRLLEFWIAYTYIAVMEDSLDQSKYVTGQRLRFSFEGFVNISLQQ
jgi:hypothetical protein